MNEYNYDLFYEFEKSIVKIINKFTLIPSPKRDWPFLNLF